LAEADEAKEYGMIDEILVRVRIRDTKSIEKSLVPSLMDEPKCRFFSLLLLKVIK